MSSIDFRNLSNLVWSGYALSEMSLLMGDSEWEPLAQFGLSLGTDYLKDWSLKRNSPKIDLNDPFKKSRQYLLQTNNRNTIQTAFNNNATTLDRVAAKWQLNNPNSTPYTGQPLWDGKLDFNPTLQVLTVLSPSDFISLMLLKDNISTAFNPDAPILDRLQAKDALSSAMDLDIPDVSETKLTDNNGPPSKSSMFSTENIASTGAGMAGGMLGNYAGTYLGSKVFGDSKGGQFLSGTTGALAGQAAGSVASLIGTNIATRSGAFTGVGSSLGSSFTNAASLTSLGAGIGNIALDTFDPVKKAKWENAANIGMGLASIAVPWVGLGALAFNAIGHGFGSKTQNYTFDSDLYKDATTYGGATKDALKALQLAGTKHSLLDSSGRHEDDNFISEVKTQEATLNDIIGYSNLRRDLALETSGINNFRVGNDARGRYDLRYALKVGRNGMKLDRVRRIVANVNKFLKGGPVKTHKHWDSSMLPKEKLSYDEWVKDVNKDFLGDKYDLKSAYEYYPLEMMERWKYAVNSNDPDWYMNYKDKNNNYIYHTGSIAEMPNGDYIFLKLGKEEDNPELHFETDTYKDGSNGLKETHDLVYEGDRYYYRRKAAKHKEGGLLLNYTSINLVDFTTVELDDEDDIEAFKNGGSVNVIPEGALHARKHNMDIKGITPKGIPVVDDEDELHAEIEREEIIFRLELTSKLEELLKLYDDEESSKSDKEKAALEAGKLLVYEILHNTVDNTNNLI